MSTDARLNLSLDCFKDPRSVKHHAVENCKEKGGKFAVRVDLRSFCLKGYDSLDHYLKLPYWMNEYYMFIVLDENGQEVERWYKGKRIDTMPHIPPNDNDGIDPLPEKTLPTLRWEVERKTEREVKENVIALRNELRRMLGR